MQEDIPSHLLQLYNNIFFEALARRHVIHDAIIFSFDLMLRPASYKQK